MKKNEFLKRIIAALTACVMCFSLVACNVNINLNTHEDNGAKEVAPVEDTDNYLAENDAENDDNSSEENEVENAGEITISISRLPFLKTLFSAVIIPSLPIMEV